MHLSEKVCTFLKRFAPFFHEIGGKFKINPGKKKWVAGGSGQENIYLIKKKLKKFWSKKIINQSDHLTKSESESESEAESERATTTARGVLSPSTLLALRVGVI
ncbi:hypothetical protein L3055_11175 [Corynebacterium sp. MC-02]|nr:hypothetical protein [Corynebacterium pseudokroppenstedtii]